MADNQSLKTPGAITIRGKIIWGYTGIYGLIALIAAVMLFITCYFIVYDESRDRVKDELTEILSGLPQDAGEQQLFELLQSKMPGYVERYDLYLNIETPAPYSDSTPLPEPAVTPEDRIPGPTDSVPDMEIIATFYAQGELNVRSGPSTGYDVIGTLSENQPVDVLEMTGEWYRVLYMGYEGWVYGPYLADRPPSTYIDRVHLLSSAGVDMSYSKSFDYAQASSAVANLRELSRLYTYTQHITYRYDDAYRYELLHYYSIEAVSDMGAFLRESGMYGRILELAAIAFTFLAAFVIGLVIIVMYGAFKTRKFLRPIEDITNLVSQINEGNLSRRIDIESARYELKELVMTINGMLDRVYAGYAKQKMFVSDVSHELRTPISVVAGYANMLKRWAKDDQAVFDESVQAIIEEADNMKYLVDNLLFLVRSDNNTISYDMESFNLSELMRDVFKSSLLLDNNKHTMTADIQDDVLVSGDRARIKQAVRIFIENAVKYTPPTGRIRLGLKKDGQSVAITISDDGVGISKKDMAHIFKRFYRGDKSRNRQAGGYGLGLPIARSIIAAHGGKIHLRSKENEGTTVDIVLNA